MATVKIKELRTGDVIRSYSIFSDDKWHFVRDVGSGRNASQVYLALEDFGSGQFNQDEEVERQ